jgi:protoheme IX farnesyltransferase
MAAVILLERAAIIADRSRELGPTTLENLAAASQQVASGRTARQFLGCYLELSKARLASFVVLTAVVGYLLGARVDAHLSGLVWIAVGTALSAFGANILNQLLEADRDRLMERTRGRPLPSLRVGRREVAVWGLASAVAGLVVLATGTNWLTTGLSLFTILLYVLVYTPLKVRTPFNTAVGAVCGAVPPMMGWTAGAGRLELGAWILFGILFFWQVPHFLSLAWLYRADYERGGFRMMPSVDRDGGLTGRLAVLYAAALLPITAALSWIGLSGTVFLVCSQLLGVGFALVGWKFLQLRSQTAARRLFLASIIYLPLLMVLMVGDRNVPPTPAGRGAQARVATTVESSPASTRALVKF